MKSVNQVSQSIVGLVYFKLLNNDDDDDDDEGHF